MGRIVVGVDGSEGSLGALRWALDEAALRGATVEVTHAYAEPMLAAYPMLVHEPAPEEVHAAAEAIVEAALEKVGGSGEVPVERRAVLGGAAGVLCECAKGAELLVVGTRGRGGFRGLLLGSVSQQVVTHSPCPVVTVVAEAS